MPTNPTGCRLGSHTHRTPAGQLRVQGLDGGTTVDVSGRIGRQDAAVLSACLHRQLDVRPRVLVLDLRDAEPAAPDILDILRSIRRRARVQGVGLHVLDRSGLRLGAVLDELSPGRRPREAAPPPQRGRRARASRDPLGPLSAAPARERTGPAARRG
jgi:hypothetical protein